MKVTIHLPDDIAQRIQDQHGDVSRYVLERVALRWYQTGAVSEEHVRRLLGYGTRLEVHAFLKAHDVPLRDSMQDLEQDRATHDRLGI